jgi:small conductance mechanosensitive channel
MTTQDSGSTTSVADQVIDKLNSAQFELSEFIVAAGVLIIGALLGRLAGRLVGRWFRNSRAVPAVIAADAAAGVRWLIYLVAIGAAANVVGVNIVWFGLAAIVFLVVAVLVLRPQVENLAAGIVLTTRSSFALGDVIEVDDTIGSVVDIGSHSTAIETIDGTRFHRPNKELIRQTVIVYSVHDTRRATFDLVLAPHTDLDLATSVITDALAGAPIIVDDPAPDVIASEIEVDAVQLTVAIWFPSRMISDEPALDAAIRATYAALEDAGLELHVLDISIVEPPASKPADGGG